MGVASPSTASSRSTRTADSSRKAAPTASGSSTRRCSSCDTMPASARSLTPRRRWSPPVAAPRRACCCSSEPGHDADGRAAQRPPPPDTAQRYICDATEPAYRTERERRVDHPAAHERKAERAAVAQGGRDPGAPRERGEGGLRAGRLPRRPHLRHRRASRALARILLPLLRVEGGGLPRGRGRGRRAPERSAEQRHPRPDRRRRRRTSGSTRRSASTWRATATRLGSWA